VYAQVTATQELAEDVFDAINSQVACRTARCDRERAVVAGENARITARARANERWFGC
jgi:hypothetical protein